MYLEEEARDYALGGVAQDRDADAVLRVVAELRRVAAVAVAAAEERLSQPAAHRVGPRAARTTAAVGEVGFVRGGPMSCRGEREGEASTSTVEGAAPTATPLSTRDHTQKRRGTPSRAPRGRRAMTRRRWRCAGKKRRRLRRTAAAARPEDNRAARLDRRRRRPRARRDTWQSGCVHSVSQRRDSGAMQQSSSAVPLFAAHMSRRITRPNDVPPHLGMWTKCEIVQRRCGCLTTTSPPGRDGQWSDSSQSITCAPAMVKTMMQRNVSWKVQASWLRASSAPRPSHHVM